VKWDETLEFHHEGMDARQGEMMTSYEEKSVAACGSPVDSLMRSLTLLRQGRIAEAAVSLASSTECVDVSSAPDQRYQCLLLSAWLGLAQIGGKAGLTQLREALAFGREAGMLGCVLCQAPDILAALCSEALAAGIETEYVQRLILHSNLSPPSPAVLRWPFPIRIHTLGRPTIVVDGKPVVFSGKAQRRPLELLYYVVANGGREVAIDRMVSSLWPEEDGGGSRGAFDMALNRLRRLLTRPEAVLLHCGRLSLSDSLCWVDLRTLERLLGDSDSETDVLCGLALLERALELHQGDFLQGEEAGWVILARERLRARIMRSIKRTGQSLEQAGYWTEAARLYDRAREMFPLEEDLCRRLLRSHIQQGEFAQAADLYKRCRELFAKVLGVLPSASTVSLINRLPPGQRA